MFQNYHSRKACLLSYISFKPHAVGFIIFLLSASACNHAKREGESNNTEKRIYEKQLDLVDVMILKKKPFQKEIICNGKLKALRKSELRFKVAGELLQLNVKNGNSVAAGQTIAILDQFEYRQRIEQAQTSLKMASINLQDELLSYGRGKMKKDSVPPAIYEAAAIRSGYVASLRELKTAEFNLAGTILKAPFSGKVANVKRNVHEQTSAGEAFCTIIDDKEFEVEFHLIESEIADVKVNNKVKVIPFAVNTPYNGIISEINPLVEESGLVLVKARIKNNGKLWEGMNVKVLIEKEVASQLVVPKSAIVLRQNQEVLFKYVNGKAFWTYVQTGQENSTSYTVVAHPDKGGVLLPGDTIIISDNLNLAHESEVTVKQ